MATNMENFAIKLLEKPEVDDLIEAAESVFYRCIAKVSGRYQTVGFALNAF